MNFLKMLIELPLLLIILIFAFVNNDLATFSLWPFSLEITVSLSVAVITLILFGFLIGKLDSWISYAPLRKSLRQQKKANKKLNKEHMKLAEKVTGLQDNIYSLKIEKAKVKEPKPPFRERVKKFFSRKKDQDNAQSF